MLAKSWYADSAREIDYALRQLYLLAADPEIDFESKAQSLLKIGCEALNLSLGIISKVTDERYVVKFSFGVLDAPTVGTSFDLSGTYCVHTLEASDVTAFHHVGASAIKTHPCYADFGLESYIGVPLTVHGKARGTLNFSCASARPKPFSAKELELVRFFGKWISKEWERKLEKHDLENKTMLLESILEAMPDAMVFANRHREIVAVNPAAEKMFGYPSSDLEGRRSSALYASLDVYEEAGQRAYNQEVSGKSAPMMVDYMHKSGRIVVGETHSAPMDSASGDRIGYLAVIRDATSRSRADTERDNAIAAASHELKTPITALKGALRLLELYTTDLPSDAKQLLTSAARSSDRLEALTRSILDAGRLSAQSRQVQFEEVSLSLLLQSCVFDTERFAEDNDVQVVAPKTTRADYVVRGIEAMLLQLAVNLVTNAIKASPKGGVVELGLFPDRAGFWVKDNGQGIPERIRPVLYDRFTKAGETSYRFGGGTGLGMSIVKAVVDQHHGSISFDSEIGVGTTFYVELPEVE
ncbi:ATP-binding protein [Roseivivax sp. THAF30]|uniref:ATP-binding protein n=1 Tax=Roseivivax sp. THAF30 TaxID=2587852 RepID=UPI0012682FF4|nr:ATP-binding protein [Roseivivax sp. THAF30]QFT64371.1 Sensor protein kinase WalK [Roseivivax sp. THAF30]